MGGAQRAMVGCANGLISIGWKVIFATDFREMPFSKVGLDDSVIREDLKCRSLLANALQMAYLINKYKPNMLFTSMLTPSIICAIAKCVSGYPVRFVIRHGTPVKPDMSLSRPRRALAKIKEFMVKAAYNKSDLILATSPGTAADIQEWYHLNPEKVEVCPNPLPIDQFPILETVDGKGDANVFYDFICVARLDTNKNVDTLIMAFHELLKSRGYVKLCIVGEGTEKKNLEDLTKKLGAENNVTFVGNSDDVKEYYKISRCFVLVSINEEFGMVFVEAMRCGLRCVAGKWANGPQYIHSLVHNMELVEVNRVEDIASAMSACLDKSYGNDRGIVSLSTMGFAEDYVVDSYLIPAFTRHNII